jgi:hypothetical protein
MDVVTRKEPARISGGTSTVSPFLNVHIVEMQSNRAVWVLCHSHDSQRNENRLVVIEGRIPCSVEDK